MPRRLGRHDIVVHASARLDRARCLGRRYERRRHVDTRLPDSWALMWLRNQATLEDRRPAPTLQSLPSAQSDAAVSLSPSLSLFLSVLLPAMPLLLLRVVTRSGLRLELHSHAFHLKFRLHPAVWLVTLTRLHPALFCAAVFILF